MSIPTPFNPLGTLGTHGFQLPYALTGGLLDAVVIGKPYSYNKHQVVDNKMDAFEVAPILLQTQTAFVLTGYESVYCNVFVSDDTDCFTLTYIPNELSYSGLYFYNKKGNRREVHPSNPKFEKGDIYAVTNLLNIDEEVLVVHAGNEYVSYMHNYKNDSTNTVKFTNLQMVFFYDYVMTATEMKEKTELIENLQL